MKENRIFLIILIIAAAVILIGHFGFHDKITEGMQNMSHTGVMQKAEKIAPNTIEVKGYAFAPAKITIKKGTTITWINYDIAPHTITVDNPNQKGPKSKLFGKGEKFTYTFSEKGTYAYHCEPHPYMKAVIEVTE